MQETDHDEKRNWIRHSEFERKKARSSSRDRKANTKQSKFFEHIIFTLIYLTDIHAQRVENLNLT